MGKYKNETRWISREDFFALKYTDPYVRYLWSFGNNGDNYMYSKEVEEWKKALHYARVFNDFSLLHEFGIDTASASRKWIRENEKECKEKYIAWYIKENGFTEEELKLYEKYKAEGVFDNLIQGSVGLNQLKNRLQRLQSLESLQRLQRLEKFQGSYEDVKIKENSVIYCDIPYKGTDEYEGGFNHEKFYEWVKSQKELVIISEYSMPDDFICIAEISKSQLFNGQGQGKIIKEKLFVHSSQMDLYRQKQGDLEQLLFDF